VSPLAAAVYDILRRQASLPEPRITYAELAERLRADSAEFDGVTHRSQALYAALGEVGRGCHRLNLPPLPALVVRADTRRPGSAYFTGRRSGTATPANPVAAWYHDLEMVKASTYPRLTRRSPDAGACPSRHSVRRR
jgi:hypothetical protein